MAKSSTTGELRERIAFDARIVADDGYGNEVSTWEEKFVVAARVLPLKGNEAVMAARLEGRQPVVITVRVSSLSKQIAADWQARNARTGVVYAIASPPTNMDEKKAFFDILASTGVAP